MSTCGLIAILTYLVKDPQSPNALNVSPRAGVTSLCGPPLPPPPSVLAPPRPAADAAFAIALPKDLFDISAD